MLMELFMTTARTSNSWESSAKWLFVMLNEEIQDKFDNIETNTQQIKYYFKITLDISFTCYR